MAEELLSGWGRAGWSRATVHRPTDLAQVLRAIGGGPYPTIARGLGRSYADQALCAGGSVIETSGLDGPIEIEPDGRVRLAAGTSIDRLLEHSVPRGWFVPVSPGTRHVTIGGAIAADIHGKNHHVDGTFCAHVEEIEMVLADDSRLRCSPTTNPTVFWATAGGMGLTGLITAATVRLTPIQSSRLLVDTTKLKTLDELMTAMVAADSRSPLSVAWIDLMPGQNPGRSVLTTARFATPDDLPARVARDPLRYEPSKPVRTPRRVPAGLLTHYSVRLFNEAWFRAASGSKKPQVQSIARYFHPLDGVDGWNRIYGPGGFLQWQMVVPDGAESALEHCVDALTQSAAPCFLAVLKRFGPANNSPLSFPLRGWTLAADIPAQHPGLDEELDRLDEVVAEAGGRIYLAKDGRMRPDLVSTMYPRLDEWRSVRDSLDPDRLWVSDMSRRLGI
ncbi:MAG: FAD-binding oxidoreductase [Acidimicrobiia bacterium]